MFKQVLTGAAVAVALGAAGSASAATYVSYLEWWDPDPITKAADPFGQVTIVEFDGYVEVTAELYDGAKFQKSGAKARAGVFLFGKRKIFHEIGERL